MKKANGKAQGAEVKKVGAKGAEVKGLQEVQTNSPQAGGKATAQDKAGAQLRKERARAVAQYLDREYKSITEVLRVMYSVAITSQGEEQGENLRQALRDDIKSVTGAEVDTYKSARDFAGAWLGALRKYATAIDEAGQYIRIVARAGMVCAGDFLPSWSAIYIEVVNNWVRGLAPIVMRRGVHYTRKGRTLTALSKQEAKAREDAYKARQEVAQAGAKAGRAEALRKYDGESAKAQG